jgi:hypothetical protein
MQTFGAWNCEAGRRIPSKRQTATTWKAIIPGAATAAGWFSAVAGETVYTPGLISLTWILPARRDKPFLLPQRRPKEYYDEQMFSYNIPELVAGKVRADKHAISSLMRKNPGIDVAFSGEAH